MTLTTLASMSLNQAPELCCQQNELGTPPHCLLLHGVDTLLSQDRPRAAAQAAPTTTCSGEMPPMSCASSAEYGLLQGLPEVQKETTVNML